MNNFEQVSLADVLRTTTLAHEPDPRTNNRCTLELQYNCIAEFTLNPSVPLDIRVHFDTAKNLYLYAWFVYRFYPVAKKHVLASLEFALRERLKLWHEEKGVKFKKLRGLAGLLKEAREKNLIVNEGLRAYQQFAQIRARDRVAHKAGDLLMAFEAESVEYDSDAAMPNEDDYSWKPLTVYEEVLPKMRNDFAHGSATLYPNVLNTFETVTDLINQLFPSSEY
jgi:hypothetical protein